jgi:hypothetical protein
MERPDITNQPPGMPDPRFRMVARTQSIGEADRIAEQYSMQGFETRIVKRAQGTISIYEVWVAKPPQIIS